MASITTEAIGRRLVQFRGTEGKRRSVRLGVVPQKIADAIKRRVELILAAKFAGVAVDDETSR